MIYVALKGGLGNQMFQYAYSYALSKETGKPVKLDITHYQHQSDKDTKRSYSLTPFTITNTIADPIEVSQFHKKISVFLRKLSRKFFPKNDYQFYPSLLQSSSKSYREGFWQTDRYFKKYRDEIIREFSLRDGFGIVAQSVADHISTIQSSGKKIVLLHVRRGDYVTNKYAASFHGTQSESYFQKALDTVLNKLGDAVYVMVATDDKEWVSSNITFPCEWEFLSRDGVKDFEEILLMAKCDHFIISNSSFSWWGAWLSENQEKIVIAPRAWIANPSINTEQVTPTEWIRM